VRVTSGNLDLRGKLDVIIVKEVTKFGSGAKIDCPKEYLGRRIKFSKTRTKTGYIYSTVSIL
jgi:putative transposon-encoded protein